MGGVGWAEGPEGPSTSEGGRGCVTAPLRVTGPTEAGGPSGLRAGVPPPDARCTDLRGVPHGERRAALFILHCHQRRATHGSPLLPPQVRVSPVYHLAVGGLWRLSFWAARLREPPGVPAGVPVSSHLVTIDPDFGRVRGLSGVPATSCQHAGLKGTMRMLAAMQQHGTLRVWVGRQAARQAGSHKGIRAGIKLCRGQRADAAAPRSGSGYSDTAAGQVGKDFESRAGLHNGHAGHC